MAADGGGGGIPGEGKLRSYVERIERLNEDKKAVTADLGEVFNEAANEGYDKAALRVVVKRRANPTKFAELDTLVDLYESALGGSRPRRPAPPPGKADDPDAPGLFDGDPAETVTPPAPETGKFFVPPVPDTPQLAREKGQAAAKAGEAITANPYRAGDTNRIHWDEAWCAETGTDGMDLPSAWKPTNPPSADQSADAPAEEAQP